MARVLIAGCGWLGEALGMTLAARGDTVWGLRRNAALLPDTIQPLEADLVDPATLARLPAPLDAVVFAAAPERSDEAAYRGTYVHGLGNLLAALTGAAQPPPRVVVLSSTSVYGQSDGEWVDELSATEPADFRGRLVLEGETLLARSELSSSSTAIRLGGLYGPGRESMIDAVRDRRATLDPGPARFTNRIHRDDAAGAIVHLLDLPAARLDRVYVAADEEPASRNDVLRFIASRLGVELAEAAEAPADNERGRRRDPHKRCSSARLRAAGYRFRHPTYREGYGALIAARD